MAGVDRAGWRVEDRVAAYFRRDPPDPDGLSWWLAPLPVWIENIALRLAWPIVIINLGGTAFGLWYYYQLQFAAIPVYLWPVVGASPLATLFMAVSLASWRLDLDLQWLHALAFFGNVQFGLWTPYVQLFLEPPGLPAWLYWFLIASHLLMFTQAFLIHRYATFSLGAIGVATAWYGLNLVTDYFVPIGGVYTHSRLRAEIVAGAMDHSVAAHGYAAAAAVLLTILCVALALATFLEKRR